MWNYLLEMRDKKTREVTKEWSIQSNATRNRCFTPDFPISGGKHFWKEIIQHYVKTVASFTTSNTAQLNSYEECQTSWNCSIIFVMAFLFRLMLQGFWCCVHHSLTCQRQTKPRLLKSTLATFHQTRSRESVDLKHFQRLNGPWASNF